MNASPFIGEGGGKGGYSVDLYSASVFGAQLEAWGLRASQKGDTSRDRVCCTLGGLLSKPFPVKSKAACKEYGLC